MHMTLRIHLMIVGFTAFVVIITACRGPLPCVDCDEYADEDEPPADVPEPAPSLPDLPCGGADLMNDSHNCGSCGNECPLWYEGTEWEAGTCVGGMCGPSWTTCTTDNGVFTTCEALCGFGTSPCVPHGCSGLTALLFDVLDFSFTPCDIELSSPYAVMTGACDEPIPWESDIDSSTSVQCCCDI